MLRWNKNPCDSHNAREVIILLCFPSSSLPRTRWTIIERRFSDDHNFEFSKHLRFNTANELKFREKKITKPPKKMLKIQKSKKNSKQKTQKNLKTENFPQQLLSTQKEEEKKIKNFKNAKKKFILLRR